MRILVLLVGALALAPLASAQADNNAGTVKVHDNEAETPPQRNVPHVQCDFWIEGFSMADDAGYLVFFSWPPTGNKSLVTPGGASLEWMADATDAQGRHHFLSGPFTLPDGHYRVEVYTFDGRPGAAEGHFAKAKTFWVECDTTTVNLPCPPGLVAVALAGGEVRLTWEAVVGAEGYNVYRAEGEGDFELVASTAGATFLDDSLEGGVVYSYYVTAFADARESVGCEPVTVTAIPFFGAPLLVGLAAAGAVGTYALLRRRG